MSKAWDLSCTCEPRFPPDSRFYCPYCKRRLLEQIKDAKMSADWLDDRDKGDDRFLKDAREVPDPDTALRAKHLDAPRGYHLADIPRGVFGEASKVVEEALELQDAVEQRNPIMALVELADLIGAVEGYLDKHHPGVSLEDVRTMTAATRRAFTNGHRSAR